VTAPALLFAVPAALAYLGLYRASREHAQVLAPAVPLILWAATVALLFTRS
jgi:hypothetical protein